VEEDGEIRTTNSRPTDKARGKEHKALQSLQVTEKKKTFSGAAFADDVAEEDSDFKAILQ
jgi:hypothetical protein